jgi:hypothetical protein
MSGVATTDLGKRARTPSWVWLLLMAVAAIFLAANAHLIYVATTSQPACVEHFRHSQMQGQGVAEHGQLAAAQSSCSPLSTERTGSP